MVLPNCRNTAVTIRLAMISATPPIGALKKKRMKMSAQIISIMNRMLKEAM